MSIGSVLVPVRLVAESNGDVDEDRNKVNEFDDDDDDNNTDRCVIVLRSS